MTKRVTRLFGKSWATTRLWLLSRFAFWQSKTTSSPWGHSIRWRARNMIWLGFQIYIELTSLWNVSQDRESSKTQFGLYNHLDIRMRSKLYIKKQKQFMSKNKNTCNGEKVCQEIKSVKHVVVFWQCKTRVMLCIGFYVNVGVFTMKETKPSQMECQMSRSGQ